MNFVFNVKSSCQRYFHNFLFGNFRTMSNQIQRNLNYEDVVNLNKENLIYLIDVRENSEIQETGQLPGSIHIPLNELTKELALSQQEFENKYAKAKPTLDTQLVFSCRSGNRSQKALSAALELGYSKSAHYQGGFMDWVKNAKTNNQ